MRDEGELIRAAAGGDRRAFEELVALKRERVVRTAFQITGNLEDARDVAQVVFSRLWTALGRFDVRRRFDTWLYRITVNASIDLLRDVAARPEAASLDGGPGFAAADPSLSAEQVLLLEELRRAFAKHAARLAPRQRAAFVLREIEGLDTEEVARVLEVSPSTVRNHVLQARRILRDGLARDCPELFPRKGGLP
jgi:RNA polymerase sigma-70 factor (ECF subfamily)